MKSPRQLLDEVRQTTTGARRYSAAWRQRLAGHPAPIAALLAVLLLGYAAYRLFEPLPAGTWPRLKDSVIFEYIGWYLTQGNRLYIDVWEVKPPLAFEITAVLALVAGENVALYHVLNVLANVVAIAVGAAAAAGIVYELTDDALAAVVGGLAPFTLPMYFYRALIGFKSKYFVLAAGLVCLYLAYRDRPIASGVAGALAIGFWQLAVVFPLVALGLCWQGGRDRAGRFVVAGVLAGWVVLVPVVLWGAVPAMIAEVVLTPFIVTEGHTFVDRVGFIVRLLGKTLLVAIVGFAGLASGIQPGRVRREWPLVVVALWFTGTMLALDLDAHPDMFPWYAVVCVGVGLAVAGPARARVERRGSSRVTDGGDGQETARVTGSRVLAAGVLVMALLAVATMGGYGTGRTGLTSPDTYDTATRLDPEMTGGRTFNATETQYIYWNRVPIPTCRALGSFTQFKLVQALGIAEDRPWWQAECGRFDPAWRAVREKFGF